MDFNINDLKAMRDGFRETMHSSALLPPKNYSEESGVSDESLLEIVAALKEQTDSLNRQVDELRRQADTQSHIEEHLKEEAVTRAKDDRKYFWLGALISFVTAMLVEHGLELIQLLQGLVQS